MCSWGCLCVKETEKFFLFFLCVRNQAWNMNNVLYVILSFLSCLFNASLPTGTLFSHAFHSFFYIPLSNDYKALLSFFYIHLYIYTSYIPCFPFWWCYIIKKWTIQYFTSMFVFFFVVGWSLLFPKLTRLSLFLCFFFYCCGFFWLCYCCCYFFSVPEPKKNKFIIVVNVWFNAVVSLVGFYYYFCSPFFLICFHDFAFHSFVVIFCARMYAAPYNVCLYHCVFVSEYNK